MSTNAQHTPGPWSAEKISEYWMVSNSGRILIARCASITKNNEANARLIAAAPELLEALRDARTWLDAARSMLEGRDRQNLEQATIRAEAAITKATG